MMNLHQLRYFLAIAEEGQITQAAKRLHITQPPLTKQLQLLEKKLGIPLFDRTGRRLHLTQAGEILKERAEQILNLVEATEKELNELREGISGTLSIGSIASWGSTLIPHSIGQFHQKYPKVRIRFIEGNLQYIYNLLEKRTIEIGIVRLPINRTKFEWIAFPSEPLFVVANEKWAQKLPEKNVTIRDLKDIPLILIREEREEREETHIGKTMESIVHAYQSEGLNPIIYCECSTLQTSIRMVECGLGITIIPKTAITLISNPSLEIRRLYHETLSSTAAIIWSKQRYLSTVAKLFIQLISNTQNKLI